MSCLLRQYIDICEVSILGVYLRLFPITVHKEKLSKPREQQCISTEVQPGATLRGGLKSGNFTHLGTVPDMRTCTKRCCASKRCDLALVLDDQCFALACFSPPGWCEMTRGYSLNFKPSMAYILKKSGTSNNSTGRSIVLKYIVT